MKDTVLILAIPVIVVAAAVLAELIFVGMSKRRRSANRQRLRDLGLLRALREILMTEPIEDRKGIEMRTGTEGAARVEVTVLLGPLRITSGNSAVSISRGDATTYVGSSGQVVMNPRVETSNQPR